MDYIQMDVIHQNPQLRDVFMKLNIGAGNTVIEGFEAVDRKVGKEAYPLDYPDASAEEIRASHILEHFGHHEAPHVLREWVRVLKPGGKIRIAVPDFEKITSEFKTHPLYEAYLFGGQTDVNDYHKSMWTRDKLMLAMQECGLTDIQPWTSQNTDCASLPVSLNLEGVKPASLVVDNLVIPDGGIPAGSVPVKIKAVMSVPRYGSLAARGVMERALHEQGIPLTTTQGVYWGQLMQQMMETGVEEDLDVILTLDFDSLFTAEMLSRLLRTLVHNDHIDCLTALEPRRNGDRPLLCSGDSEINVLRDNPQPFQVKTAHFGFSVFRVENLAKVAKPWFQCQPTKEGIWDNASSEKMDADIFFWHQWRLAGNNVFVDPSIRIGHLEETVAYYDDEMLLKRCSVPEWRDIFLKA